MNLPYTRIIRKIVDESGEYYIGEILEISEARTVADTLGKLEERFDEVLRLSIRVRMEDGESIPEPIPDDKYSGKFVLRIPKSLHRELSIAAEEEGISLNQYAMYKLSK